MRLYSKVYYLLSIYVASSKTAEQESPDIFSVEYFCFLVIYGSVSSW